MSVVARAHEPRERVWGRGGRVGGDVRGGAVRGIAVDGAAPVICGLVAGSVAGVVGAVTGPDPEVPVLPLAPEELPAT